MLTVFGTGGFEKLVAFKAALVAQLSKHDLDVPDWVEALGKPS